MIDQATELRQLVLAAQATARPRSAVRRSPASVVTIVGGAPGVGATTVARNLSIAYRQAGSETVVVDAGALSAVDDPPAAPEGGAVVLVIGPEQASITGAYTALKRYRAPGLDLEYFILGNQARLADLVYADRLQRSQQRLAESARQFLDLRVVPLGTIAHSVHLESYRGDRAQWVHPTIATAIEASGAVSNAARQFAEVVNQLLEKN